MLQYIIYAPVPIASLNQLHTWIYLIYLSSQTHMLLQFSLQQAATHKHAFSKEHLQWMQEWVFKSWLGLKQTMVSSNVNLLVKRDFSSVKTIS